jgi:hypothetical protein
MLHTREYDDGFYKYIGKVLVDSSNTFRVIQGIYQDYDNIYRLSEGRFGNAYRIYLLVAGNDEMESFHFRDFEEVINKYGKIMDKPDASLSINTKYREKPELFAKRTKIYPEK